MGMDRGGQKPEGANKIRFSKVPGQYPYLPVPRP